VSHWFLGASNASCPLTPPPTPVPLTPHHRSPSLVQAPGWILSAHNVRVRPEAGGGEVEGDVGSVIDKKEGRRPRLPGLALDGGSGSLGKDGSSVGDVAGAGAGPGATSDGSDDEILNRDDLKKVSHSIVLTNERKQRAARRAAKAAAAAAM
jgi:hypothetical protein